MDALAFTNQDPEVLALGEEYLHAVVWVVPPLLWYATVNRRRASSLRLSATIPLDGALVSDRRRRADFEVWLN